MTDTVYAVPHNRNGEGWRFHGGGAASRPYNAPRRCSTWITSNRRLEAEDWTKNSELRCQFWLPAEPFLDGAAFGKSLQHIGRN